MTHPAARPDDAARLTIVEGRATLGIEFGSTRIKACLIDDGFTTLATGSVEWQNEFVDGRWTYALDAITAGLQAAYASLVAETRARFGVAPTTLRAIGVSAMMHGYLACDAGGTLLVPFRTWRNSSTGPASAALTEALDFAVPLRWSVAHLYQAVLDAEPHVPDVASITTLAGYVHRSLTGENVLGVGDASGMVPIDPATATYDARRLEAAETLLRESAAAPIRTLEALLPRVLSAGQSAGALTPRGATLLDPTGTLRPGIPFCPPEGDAGTGMVATNAVAPRTGNVSVGTSIFAMVVLDEPLSATHPEIDVVTTPAGHAVAMVHCNNGASELASWARIFGRFGEASGHAASADDVFAVLLAEATSGSGTDADAGGLLSYNYLSGEPITGVDEGRPLLLRRPESRFTLGNLIRSELFSAFATLSIGMEVLSDEGVRVERLLAHGGLFRTPGAAQKLLAAAVGVPVAVEATAGEGGAWGIAVLAAYLRRATDRSLEAYLADEVFVGVEAVVADPDPADEAGFAAYLERFRDGLPLERAAARAPRSWGPVVDDAIAATRQQVASLHAELTRNALVTWTGGNVSGRVPGADLFVIKPSGVSYDDLAPENMILCDLDGAVIPGSAGSDRAPSSDTAAHAYVYRHMPHVGGVVHTHSTYATAWASRGEAIPCVITAMADEFGGPIPVGPFAIIGDDSIGRGIVATLTGHRSRAVLMQNHGVFTIGRDARDAVKAAVMTEDVARTVHIAHQLGTPIPLPEESIDALFDRYQNVYGQTPEGAQK